MKRLLTPLFPLTLALFTNVPQLSGQIGNVIQGRIQDSSSGSPVPNALVVAADSTRSTLSDASGVFIIQLPLGAPLHLQVSRTGYAEQSFELPSDAASRPVLLLVDPAPVELAAVEVDVEGASTQLIAELARRRDRTPGAVSFYDRTYIEDRMTSGNAWEFVTARLSGISECPLSTSGLCVRNPREASWGDALVNGMTGDAINPEVPKVDLNVCIDGKRSTQAAQEMKLIDASDLALVEIYKRGREGLAIFTTDFLTRFARLMAQGLASPNQLTIPTVSSFGGSWKC